MGYFSVQVLSNTTFSDCYACLAASWTWFCSSIWSFYYWISTGIHTGNVSTCLRHLPIRSFLGWGEGRGRPNVLCFSTMSACNISMFGFTNFFSMHFQGSLITSIDYLLILIWSLDIAQLEPQLRDYVPLTHFWRHLVPPHQYSFADLSHCWWEIYPNCQ